MLIASRVEQPASAPGDLPVFISHNCGFPCIAARNQTNNSVLTIADVGVFQVTFVFLHRKYTERMPEFIIVAGKSLITKLLSPSEKRRVLCILMVRSFPNRSPFPAPHQQN
jgi:hypothetical protein